MVWSHMGYGTLWQRYLCGKKKPNRDYNHTADRTQKITDHFTLLKPAGWQCNIEKCLILADKDILTKWKPRSLKGTIKCQLKANKIWMYRYQWWSIITYYRCSATLVFSRNIQRNRTYSHCEKSIIARVVVRQGQSECRGARPVWSLDAWMRSSKLSNVVNKSIYSLINWWWQLFVTH